jgi:hypothetical protein
LALAVIRPALVEAKLLTDKHAHDVVYIVTLADELRSIEDKIAAVEEALQLVSQPEGDLALGRACRPPQDGPDAHWIRAKSSELTQRLRRIEQSDSLAVQKRAAGRSDLERRSRSSTLPRSGLGDDLRED